MVLRLKFHFLFGALAVVGCDSGLPESGVNQSAGNEVKTGFLKIDDSYEKVEYKVDGKFAVLDECSRVPRSSIFDRPDASVGLTTEAGVKLWPKGIVPYVLEGGFPADFMAAAAEQFKRADIIMIPRTTENVYLSVKMITPQSPECKKGVCEGIAGYSNAIGFAKSTDTDRVAFKQSNDGGIITVYNDPLRFPQLIISPEYDFRPSNSTPEAWRKYGMFTLLHEIGHAIGARHEQAHPDAKKYIKKLEEGVGYEKRYPTEQVTKFDIKSVMLYCDFFARKGKKSDDPICDIMNMPTQLSDLDVAGLRKLYSKEIAKRTQVSSSPAPSAPSAPSVQTANTAGGSAAKPSAPLAKQVGSNGSQTNPPVPPTGSGSGSTCQTFPRSPVNDGNGDCGDACRGQLRSAAAVVGVAIPGNLSSNSVARDLYDKIRQRGASSGCDPLKNTKYK
ncbi:MAG: hypothetical protein RI932_297 [Pseudomonadota bacterium]|jgi:hypothetical protein